jgi:hypothetical protein
MKYFAYSDLICISNRRMEDYEDSIGNKQDQMGTIEPSEWESGGLHQGFSVLY